MDEWNEILSEITALNEIEKKEIQFVADLVAALTERRKRLDMSQRDLAEKCGVKQPMIARIESGASIPRLDTLFKLAFALGLTDFQLVFNDETAAALAS
ncbi:hypothetical protein CBW65_10270 [Tumebacillus avium]|uniref:HTH cro/C1-type domain-containing protein n=1 Tax=Tumebacillus avium TaxID=1903704 RepID=A0A1Y0ILE3_9BACL|nr:helix-turn-helix transcriptional regulator [Tumebacillus avium]ARU61341.1 hypothetical protein CBW65_10270 [Tumebacillus avium]